MSSRGELPDQLERAFHITVQCREGTVAKDIKDRGMSQPSLSTFETALPSSRIMAHAVPQDNQSTMSIPTCLSSLQHPDFLSSHKL